MLQPLLLCLLLCASQIVLGAIVPSRNLEQLSRESHIILRGTVIRQWSAWDNDRRIIWTHTEVRSSGVWKGRRTASFIVSEPGGEVEGVKMAAEGVPIYSPGEDVVIFAKEVLPGLWRTSNLATGKLTVKASDAGLVVSGEVAGLQSIAAGGSPGRAAAIVPEGTTLDALRRDVEKALAAGDAK